MKQSCDIVLGAKKLVVKEFYEVSAISATNRNYIREITYV